jgi:prevent-host-death family protein
MMRMRQINAVDFKNSFGEYLDLAKDEPIAVCKSGKPVAVMMSVEEYLALQQLEDAFWKSRAEVAEALGEWVEPAEAMRVLTSRLKRGK